MATRVRSFAKINLGLAIGAPRADGFHELRTLYQTIALHDVLSVSARPALRTRIRLQTNNSGVPVDGRNTVWKMVEKALERLGRTAEVSVHIDKRLPIQGGLGAGSGNAAAALVGLERELGLKIAAATRLALAAEVGSDVPLFLVGGAVLGRNRGEVVEPAPPLTLAGETEIACVIALPGHGISTPQAFRDWDAHLQRTGESPVEGAGASAGSAEGAGSGLRNPVECDTLGQLSRTYARVFGGSPGVTSVESGASGIFPEPGPAQKPKDGEVQDSPENLHGRSREQLQASETLPKGSSLAQRSGFEIDLAENTLLALVRTGIANDFETVVFAQNPSLREIKRHLMGSSDEEQCADQAVFASLSGSGSALFGLFRSPAHALAAQQRLQKHGVKALVTKTLPRPLFWSEMFAE